MKKLIVLASSVIIAAGAAAQADKTGSHTTEATRTGNVDRQMPPDIGRDGRDGRDERDERNMRDSAAAAGPESATVIEPRFQGSSKQAATSSGPGQPKKEGERASGKTRPDVQDVQDVEDKTKR